MTAASLLARLAIITFMINVLAGIFALPQIQPLFGVSLEEIEGANITTLQEIKSQAEAGLNITVETTTQSGFTLFQMIKASTGILQLLLNVAFGLPLFVRAICVLMGLGFIANIVYNALMIFVLFVYVLGVVSFLRGMEVSI